MWNQNLSSRRFLKIICEKKGKWKVQVKTARKKEGKIKEKKIQEKEEKGKEEEENEEEVNELKKWWRQ